MSGIFNRSNQIDLDYKVSIVEYYITLLTHLFMKDLSDAWSECLFIFYEIQLTWITCFKFLVNSNN